MSTTKMTHTPGPWRVGAELDVYGDNWEKPGYGGYRICACDVEEYSDDPERDGFHPIVDGPEESEAKANARLIASAPDAHRILTRIGQALRDGHEPSLYAKMDTGETIADAIEAYLAKGEAT